MKKAIFYQKKKLWKPTKTRKNYENQPKTNNNKKTCKRSSLYIDNHHHHLAPLISHPWSDLDLHSLGLHPRLSHNLDSCQVPWIVHCPISLNQHQHKNIKNCWQLPISDSLPTSGPILTHASTQDLLSRTISLLLTGGRIMSTIDIINSS